jgi:hypothetical protein
MAMTGTEYLLPHQAQNEGFIVAVSLKLQCTFAHLGIYALLMARSTGDRSISFHSSLGHVRLTLQKSKQKIRKLQKLA